MELGFLCIFIHCSSPSLSITEAGALFTEDAEQVSRLFSKLFS